MLNMCTVVQHTSVWINSSNCDVTYCFSVLNSMLVWSLGLSNSSEHAAQQYFGSIVCILVENCSSWWCTAWCTRLCRLGVSWLPCSDRWLGLGGTHSIHWKYHHVHLCLLICSLVCAYFGCMTMCWWAKMKKMKQTSRHSMGGDCCTVAWIRMAPWHRTTNWKFPIKDDWKCKTAPKDGFLCGVL